jgi:type II secretion system protein J
MSGASAKRGFTLIEILVATALITVIIAMVYGSYSIASKSAKACTSRIALLNETRNALTQMSRQISCSYAGRKETQTSSDKAVFEKEKITRKKMNTLFEGDCDRVNGQILHFVTTKSALRNQQAVDGLFEVIYKFDKNTGRLFFSETKFLGSSTPLDRNRFWLPIGIDITAVKLAFYDGQKWLEKWDIKQKLSLPCAVKVEITVDHEDCRPYHYTTIVSVYCQAVETEQNKTEILVSANI